MWTYLQGSIKVSVPTHTFYTQETLKAFVEWAISDIQETTNITGSERNVDISVHPLDMNGFIGKYINLRWKHAYPMEWNKKPKKRMTNRQLAKWLAKGIQQ